MGTNYYAEIDRCEHCGRAADRIHIGKQSAGWAFALHAMPERDLMSCKAWGQFLIKPEITIIDEYGETVLRIDLLQKIRKNRDRKKDTGGLYFIDSDGYWFVHGEFS